MDNVLIKKIIEGALLAAGQPLTIDRMLQLFEGDAIDRKIIKDILDEIKLSCEDRGFELSEVASGFRFQVKKSIGPWVIKLWNEKAPRYSRALLETLALIAYRQPITRAEIEEVRGVSVSSNIVKTLLEREWVRVVGYRDVPGRPALYATTKAFLDYFELQRLDDLPTLAEIRDLDKINQELDLNEEKEKIETSDIENVDEKEVEYSSLESNPLISASDDAETSSPEEELVIDFSEVDEVLNQFEVSFRQDKKLTESEQINRESQEKASEDSEKSNDEKVASTIDKNVN